MTSLDRRAVLLATAGTTLIALANNTNNKALAAEASVESKTITLGGRQLDVFKVADMSITSEAEISNWSTLISRITSTGYDIDGFNNPFEKGAFGALATIRSEETNGLTHNPRLVEPLLGEISSLIDRCIAYRKESADLEISGVAAGASRLTADALDEIDKELAASDIVGSAAGILAAKYSPAIELFNSATDVKLGQGNAKQMEGLVAANSDITTNSAAKTKLILSRLTFTQEVNRQLMSRYNVPGNAHNFTERFDRMRRLFDSDIFAAYRKAIAAAVGLKDIFGYTDPLYENLNPALPVLKESGFIDELLIWTRNAMRAVTKIGEIEVDVTRYIAIPIPPVPAAPGVVAAFTFKIDGLFAGLKNIRLRTIAASYCLDGGDFKNDINGNAAIGLILTKSEVKTGPKATALLPDVKQWGAQAQASPASGALLYNLDPTGMVTTHPYFDLRIFGSGAASLWRFGYCQD